MTSPAGRRHWITGTTRSGRLIVRPRPDSRDRGQLQPFSECIPGGNNVSVPGTRHCGSAVRLWPCSPPFSQAMCGTLSITRWLSARPGEPQVNRAQSRAPCGRSGDRLPRSLPSRVPPALVPFRLSLLCLVSLRSGPGVPPPHIPSHPPRLPESSWASGSRSELYESLYGRPICVVAPPITGPSSFRGQCFFASRKASADILAASGLGLDHARFVPCCSSD